MHFRCILKHRLCRITIREKVLGWTPTVISKRQMLRFIYIQLVRNLLREKQRKYKQLEVYFLILFYQNGVINITVSFLFCFEHLLSQNTFILMSTLTNGCCAFPNCEHCNFLSPYLSYKLLYNKPPLENTSFLYFRLEYHPPLWYREENDKLLVSLLNRKARDFKRPE